MSSIERLYCAYTYILSYGVCVSQCNHIQYCCSVCTHVHTYVHTYIRYCRIVTVLLVCTGDDSQRTNRWLNVLDSLKLSSVVSPLGWQDDGLGEDKGETCCHGNIWACTSVRG